MEATRNTESVADLLLARKESRSSPDNRSDGASIALVIEGGGMRGVVSGGMVTALHELGLTNSFDQIVGTSAGALAGAYLLSGEPEKGTSIYYDDLTGREWLDFKRVLKREPVLNIDYLIDQIITHKKPLDFDAVLASRIGFHAIATSLPDFRPMLLSNPATPQDLRESLRASARIPLLSGPPIKIDGTHCIDGAESQPIPVQAAKTIGATHVVALLTRPAGRTKKPSSLLTRKILYPSANKMLSGLGDSQANKPLRYQEQLTELNQMLTQSLVVQVPSDQAEIGSLEQNPNILYDGAQAGKRAVYHALSSLANN